MKQIACAMLAASAMLMLPACGGNKPKEVVTAKVLPNDDYIQPQKFEAGLGIHARMDGRDLIISAKNDTNKELIVAYPDFAFIMGSTPKDLLFLTANMADTKRFSEMVLKPGTADVRRIPIRIQDELRGRRMVYNNRRDKITFFVVVE